MKKLTKQQLKAVKDLVYDLDELDNKPRRLFYTLEKLAFAFDKDKAVPAIREAQDLMYSHIREGQHYEELFNSLRAYKIKEWEWQIKSSSEIGDSEMKIYAVERFIRGHISNLAERRFN